MISGYPSASGRMSQTISSRIIGTNPNPNYRTPEQRFEFERIQDEFKRAQEMAPYQLGQAKTGLELSQFELGQRQQISPYQIGQARLGMEQASFNLGEQRRQRDIESTIERGPSLSDQMLRMMNPYAFQGVRDPYEDASKTELGRQLLQQRRMRELELQKAEFEGRAYGGGGFASWSTPAFPMTGR
jgi:hypothetical protein